jgi:uncharacterized BrkB/YihY/UPF0761 family membrane protein
MMLLFWFWVSSAVLLIAAQLNKVIEDDAHESPLSARVNRSSGSA